MHVNSSTVNFTGSQFCLPERTFIHGFKHLSCFWVGGVLILQVSFWRVGHRRAAEKGPGARVGESCDRGGGWVPGNWPWLERWSWAQPVGPGVQGHGRVTAHWLSSLIHPKWRGCHQWGKRGLPSWPCWDLSSLLSNGGRYNGGAEGAAIISPQGKCCSLVSETWESKASRMKTYDTKQCMATPNQGLSGTISSRRGRGASGAVSSCRGGAAGT